MAKKKTATVTVKNYGYDWLNRLAILNEVCGQMDPEERAMAFKWIKSKFSAEWPSDSY